MAGSLFHAEERSFVEAIRGLSFGNPFLPERLELERQALGDTFVPGPPVWTVDLANLGQNPNEIEIHHRVEALAAHCCQRLRSGTRAGKTDLQLYEDLVLYGLYYRYQSRLFEEIKESSTARGGPRRMVFFRSLRDDVSELLWGVGVPQASHNRPEHVLALFFQVRRAFHHIFRFILGGSMAAARLRAAVWQSIFTHDMRRYRRNLFDRMQGISTLILGPSGTGKELVASAVGLSRYVPFSADSETFSEDFRTTFIPISLSALSPTLIESELFGHCKGAFTGATNDRIGYLQGCGAGHTVFLDEIGELDSAIQVKLLRVLQTRTFQRIGETRARDFAGKIIAATNRDLAEEMSLGHFREDFYYRLCSDFIITPSLQEQLCDSPEELRRLIVLLAQREVAGEDAEAVADEVQRWIDRSLGHSYPWPGNVRELEQCVRNVLVRGEYHPLRLPVADTGPLQRLARETCSGILSAEELLSRYCTLVYAVTGSYEEVARRLQLDRRTVKKRIDPAFLEELHQAGVSDERALAAAVPLVAPAGRRP